MYFPLLKKLTNKRNEKDKQTNKPKKKTKANRNKIKIIKKKTNKLRYTSVGIAFLRNFPPMNNRSMILPNTAVISCSVDVLPCVVTAFVSVDVPEGLVLVRTGWTKQIPRQVAVQET